MSRAVVPHAQRTAWAAGALEKQREGAQFVAMCNDLNNAWRQEDIDAIDATERARTTDDVSGGAGGATPEQAPERQHQAPACEAALEATRAGEREARVLQRSHLFGQRVADEITYNDFDRKLAALDTWRRTWGGGMSIQSEQHM